MSSHWTKARSNTRSNWNSSDEDILDALAHVSGYIDISTEDFRTVYHLAWRHALARLQGLSANDSDQDAAE